MVMTNSWFFLSFLPFAALAAVFVVWFGFISLRSLVSVKLANAFTRFFPYKTEVKGTNKCGFSP